MLRNPIPGHTRDPEDDKPERGGGRTATARRLRHDADDVDDDEDEYGDDLEDEDEDEDGDGNSEGEEKYAQSRMVAAGDARDGEPGAVGSGRRASTRDSRDDDEDDDAYDDDEQALTEVDVMAVLDRDDLKNMEGPDA